MSSSFLAHLCQVNNAPSLTFSLYLSKQLSLKGDLSHEFKVQKEMVFSFLFVCHLFYNKKKQQNKIQLTCVTSRGAPLDKSLYLLAALSYPSSSREIESDINDFIYLLMSICLLRALLEGTSEGAKNQCALAQISFDPSATFTQVEARIRLKFNHAR